MGRRDFGAVTKRQGRPGYYVRVRVAGRRIWRRAGRTKAEAEQYLERLRREIWEQTVLGAKAAHPVRFREFAKEYLEKAAADLAPSNYPKVRGKVQGVLVPALGDRLVHQIGKEEVQRLMLQRARKVSAATRNRDLSVLSSMLRYAVDLGYARSNPCKGIRRQSERERPVPFYDVAEQAALVEACDSRIRSVVAIALGTGMRQGELLRLCWPDVNLERRIAVVRESKNGRPRDVPLCKPVMDVLTRMKDGRAIPLHGPDRVFSGLPRGWNGDLGRKLSDACARAELPRLRFHDLRHVWACTAARAGVPLADVQKIGGWKTASMMLRYAGHSPSNAADRMRLLLDARLPDAQTAE